MCRNYLGRKEKQGSLCPYWKRVHEILIQLLLGELIRMVWPPQSPDLNPIEQLWDYVDTEVRKHYISSKENLWNTLVKCWNETPKEIFVKYINTMPARCQAVIDAKGGHTKY
jgi:transposase